MTAQNKFPYVDKWLSNKQINKKPSNYLWKNKKVTDAQITQTLNFRYAQYVGNHLKKRKRKTSFGHSNSKIPTAHYATKTTKTHGPTYYQSVNTPI
jgi:hypothetical protein